MEKTHIQPTLAQVSAQGLKATLDKLLAGIGQGFNAYLVSRSRMHEIERLNAKSDRKLAKLGIARDDIPRHVFRDLFYA